MSSASTGLAAFALALTLGPTVNLPKPNGPGAGPPASKVKPKPKPPTVNLPKKKRNGARPAVREDLEPNMPPIRDPTWVTGRVAAQSQTKAASLTRDSLLAGFSFRFEKSDRHLRRVGVLSHPGKVTTFFADGKYDGTHPGGGTIFDDRADITKPSGDQWSYAHAFVTPTTALRRGQVTIRCRRGGTCRQPIPVRRGHRFVLRGFKFVFDDGDRHVKRIYLKGSSEEGYIETNFSDQGNDDGYVATIQFAYVPDEWQGKNQGSELRSSATQTQQQGKATFKLREEAPRNVVLSGFDFRFADARSPASAAAGRRHQRGEVDSDDRHVREFSMRPAGGTVIGRRIEAALTDDQSPDPTIKLWLTAIDPRYIRLPPGT